MFGLFIEYFDKFVLYEIVLKVGILIKVDYNINFMGRGRYVRVCKEIALFKFLVIKIWIVNY